MEWLKNNAIVVFIIVGLITYIEVRLSDLKADLKADNRELRQELKADIRDLRSELKGDVDSLKGDIDSLKSDIQEIRGLLVTYILKTNVGVETSPLALKPKKTSPSNKGTGVARREVGSAKADFAKK